MRFQNLILAGLALGSISLAACASDVGETAGSDNEAVSASTPSYYVFTHVDARKCAYPTCGGVFVKRVNQAVTYCPDGTSGPECRVIAEDLTAIGLPAADATKIAQTFEQGHVVLRGTLTVRKDQYNHAIPTLVASEAWVGNSLSTPDGTFYAVKDNGTRCLVAPCAHIHESKLNTSTTQTIHDVDFASSGANAKQVDAAQQAMATDDVLVVGHHTSETGPGGHGMKLVASEFYTKAVAPPPADTSCGGFVGKQCAAGLYCDVTIVNACNGADLPGACKSVPQLCYQLFMPVCGCDSKTYTNDCYRLKAQVQKAHDGAC